jgi:hypothetical protein
MLLRRGAKSMKPAEPASKLPRNVWLLGFASLLNDIASEMIYPLLPNFLLGVLHGSKQYLGVIEGAAESLASLLKLFAGAWSDRVASGRIGGRRIRDRALARR